jgi:hypothetical protein
MMLILGGGLFLDVGWGLWFFLSLFCLSTLALGLWWFVGSYASFVGWVVRGMDGQRDDPGVAA